MPYLNAASKFEALSVIVATTFPLNPNSANIDSNLLAITSWVCCPGIWLQEMAADLRSRVKVSIQ